MAASAGTVHAHGNAMLCSRPAVNSAGILYSLARADNGSPERLTRADCAVRRVCIKVLSYLCPLPVRALRHQNSQTRADTQNFPFSALIPVIPVTHFFNGPADVESRFRKLPGSFAIFMCRYRLHCIGCYLQ